MSTKKKTATTESPFARKPKYVKGFDSSKKAETKSTPKSFVAKYEYPPAEIIAEPNTENELLRERLRQLTEPKPSLQSPNPTRKERQSCLNDIASGYAHQVSRLTINVDILIEVSNRIQIDKEGTAQGSQSEQPDLTSRLSNYNNNLSYQNDRLEAVLTRLQDLV
jgi:hypothetical protein